MKRGIGIAAFVCFIAVIWAANWAVQHWGVVPVGFGLEAPAGVYFAGLAFTLRDIIHHILGRATVVVAIILGAIFSWWVSDAFVVPGGISSIAVASGIAFLFSESCDLLVYEPVRRKGWLPAVVCSNAVAICVDSALFLWLAFGGLTFFWGQVVGKAWMTLAAIILLSMVALRRREAIA